MESIQIENILSKKKIWKLEKLVFYFFFYSLIGFIIEEILFIFYYKEMVYRGFLYMPILPIYGFGCVIISLVYPDKDYEALSIFVISALFCSVLEYVSSFLLEKVFSLSLWDYSMIKFNLNGRISLITSLLFGLGAIVIVKLVNPFIEKRLRKYKNNIKLDVFLTVLIIITFLDFVLSLYKYIK